MWPTDFNLQFKRNHKSIDRKPKKKKQIFQIERIQMLPKFIHRMLADEIYFVLKIMNKKYGMLSAIKYICKMCVQYKKTTYIIYPRLNGWGDFFSHFLNCSGMMRYTFLLFVLILFSTSFQSMTNIFHSILELYSRMLNIDFRF